MITLTKQEAEKILDLLETAQEEIHNEYCFDGRCRCEGYTDSIKILTDKVWSDNDND